MIQLLNNHIIYLPDTEKEVVDRYIDQLKQIGSNTIAGIEPDEWLLARTHASKDQQEQLDEQMTVQLNQTAEFLTHTMHTMMGSRGHDYAHRRVEVLVDSQATPENIRTLAIKALAGDK